jgi:hypothetical protein
VGCVTRLNGRLAVKGKMTCKSVTLTRAYAKLVDGKLECLKEVTQLQPYLCGPCIPEGVA